MRSPESLSPFVSPDIPKSSLACEVITVERVMFGDLQEGEFTSLSQNEQQGHQKIQLLENGIFEGEDTTVLTRQGSELQGVFVTRHVLREVASNQLEVTPSKLQEYLDDISVRCDRLGIPNEEDTLLDLEQQFRNLYLDRVAPLKQQRAYSEATRQEAMTIDSDQNTATILVGAENAK